MRSKGFFVILGALTCLGAVATSAAAQDYGRERREERQERREERRDEYRERREERREERRDERRGRWEELGCKRVGFGVDRDVIRVGRREGRFEAIRLEASENTVHLLDVKVVYGNGAPDDLRVQSELRAGQSTRPLDLRGRRERSIQEIQLTYRSRPSFRGFAKVCAFGRD